MIRLKIILCVMNVLVVNEYQISIEGLGDTYLVCAPKGRCIVVSDTQSCSLAYCITAKLYLNECLFY